MAGVLPFAVLVVDVPLLPLVREIDARVLYEHLDFAVRTDRKKSLPAGFGDSTKDYCSEDRILEQVDSQWEGDVDVDSFSHFVGRLDSRKLVDDALSVCDIPLTCAVLPVGHSSALLLPAGRVVADDDREDVDRTADLDVLLDTVALDGRPDCLFCILECLN